MMNKCVLLCSILAVWFVTENIAAYTYTEAEKSMIQSKLLASGVECIKEYPLSMSDIRSFKKKTMPDSENGKCFVGCLFKKNGVMDDMGNLSPKGTRQSAEQIFKGEDDLLKNIDQLMEECSAVNDVPTTDGTKGCERAKLAFNCLLENAPKYGFNTDM